MSTFESYLKLGFNHIADLAAYDHMLFIVALCAVYRAAQWKHILVLVTAFTIGHSLTLALATLGVFVIPGDIVEFLIPLTIFVTAFLNIFEHVERAERRKMSWNYGLAMFFGLIHGMGFSNYLRMLLGDEESLLQPLFAFNIGLELGQLLIVAVTMGAAYLVMNVFRAQHREWNLFVSGAAAGISLLLMVDAKFW